MWPCRRGRPAHTSHPMLRPHLHFCFAKTDRITHLGKNHSFMKIKAHFRWKTLSINVCLFWMPEYVRPAAAPMLESGYLHLHIHKCRLTPQALLFTPTPNFSLSLSPVLPHPLKDTNKLMALALTLPSAPSADPTQVGLALQLELRSSETPGTVPQPLHNFPCVLC